MDHASESVLYEDARGQRGVGCGHPAERNSSTEIGEIATRGEAAQKAYSYLVEACVDSPVALNAIVAHQTLDKVWPNILQKMLETTGRKSPTNFTHGVQFFANELGRQDWSNIHGPIQSEDCRDYFYQY